MRLRVRKVERTRLRSDRADQAAADRQRCAVHRCRFQSFAGVELEHVVGAQDIDRAHLGDHVRRDEPHHLVEPLLGADRLRHDLAEFPQEHARPGERPPNGCQADLLSGFLRRSLQPSRAAEISGFVEFVY